MNDSELLRVLLEDPELSPSSRETLKQRFEKIQSETKSFHWAMRNPSKASAILCNLDLSHKTKLSLCSCITSVFKRTPEMAQQHPGAVAAWKAICTRLGKPIQDQYESNKATDTYLSGHVPWKDVIKKRNSLPKGSTERLLLSMYTMIPPIRRNLGSCRVVRKDEIPPAKENYVFLGNPSELVLRNYKTSKFYGEKKIPLPRDLVKEIETSLSFDPRSHLFISKDEKPFKTDALYGSWVTRTFKAMFDRPMTINTLRHCFLSESGIEKKPLTERKEIASSMCHSLEMQMKYQFMDSPKASAKKTKKK